MPIYDPIQINLTPNGDTPEDLVVEALAKCNENFSQIDSAIQTHLNGLDPQNSVTSKSLSAAPTTGLSVGARFIVAVTPLVGDPWHGQAGKIAELTSTSPYAWEFIIPNKGFNLMVEDENLEYIYTGSGWASRPSVEQHNQLGGLQGGSSGERYHVSEANATGLAAGYLPTGDQKAALAGTQGTPSGLNPFVTTTDARLTNVVVQTQEITAGEALSQYQLVYGLGGKYYLARPDGIAQALNVQGLVFSASIAADATGLIIINPSLITNAGWAMTQGRPQYLATNGGITETKPADNAVCVGFAVTATSLFFYPKQPESGLLLDINADQLELNVAPVHFTPRLTAATTDVAQLGSVIAGLDDIIGILRTQAGV